MPAHAVVDVLPDLIGDLARPHYAESLLRRLRDVLPATSLSVYRTGPGTRPRRFRSASHSTPDTTHDCWRAYLSGPYKRDFTLLHPDGQPDPRAPVVCHITAAEVPGEHRTKVYEALGRAERVSVVCRETDASVFAVNFYRHVGQPPFRDSELADFGALAPAVLALTRKHLELLGVEHAPPPTVRGKLLALNPALTGRELDVCERLLRGMTQEGIAADLRLSVPTVKTYRARAFARLGIHYRNELFARLLHPWVREHPATAPGRNPAS